MKLHPPFIIGARLSPALKIGDAFLSLTGMNTAGHRHAPQFVLDIPGMEPHCIDDMRSGCGGFESTVESFETLLTFMSACAESIQYAQRTGRDAESGDLFPPAIAQWCADNLTAIESVLIDLHDDDGGIRHELITD